MRSELDEWMNEERNEKQEEKREKVFPSSRYMSYAK